MMKQMIRTLLVILCFTISSALSACAENESTNYAHQGDVCVYEQGNCYGIADGNNTPLTDAIYDMIWFFDEFQQATVKVDEKFGRIDCKGNWAFSPDEGQAFEVLHDNQGNSLLVVSINGEDSATVKLYDTTGEQIGETYEAVDMFLSGTLLVQKNGKWNILRIDGNYVDDKWWDVYYVKDSDGTIALCDWAPQVNLYYSPERVAWQYVYRDDNGNVQWCTYENGSIYEMPNEWVSCKHIGDGLISFSRLADSNEESTWGMLFGITNLHLRPVLSYVFQNEPSSIDNRKGLYIGIVREDGKDAMIIFDKTGMEYYHSSDYEKILSFDREDGLICIQRKAENTILNSMGTTVATFDSRYYIQRYRGNDIWQFTNTEDHTWGFLDSNGNILCELPNSYYDILTYVDDHNTGTYANGWMTSTWKQDGGRLFGTNTYGYVGIHGDLLYDVDWTGIYDFTANGRARVRTDNGYGFIDETGAYVVEPKYTTCEDYFQTGDQWLAYVADSTGWGYINNNGELICWNRKRTSVKGTTDISLRNANGGVLLSIPEGKEFILHGYDEKLGMFSATYGDTEGYVKGTGLMISRSGQWQTITKDELIERTK